MTEWSWMKVRMWWKMPFSLIHFHWSMIDSIATDRSLCETRPKMHGITGITNVNEAWCHRLHVWSRLSCHGEGLGKAWRRSQRKNEKVGEWRWGENRGGNCMEGKKLIVSSKGKDFKLHNNITCSWSLDWRKIIIMQVMEWLPAKCLLQSGASIYPSPQKAFRLLFPEKSWMERDFPIHQEGSASILQESIFSVLELYVLFFRDHCDLKSFYNFSIAKIVLQRFDWGMHGHHSSQSKAKSTVSVKSNKSSSICPVMQWKWASKDML